MLASSLARIIATYCKRLCFGAVAAAALASLFATGISAAQPINPVPFVDIVSPVSIHPGSTNVTLTLSGAGFVSTSTVVWNGTTLATTYVSSKELTAAVPDSFIAAVGLGSVTVVSPSPGGGTSNVTYVPAAATETSTTFPSSPTSSVIVGTTPQGIVTADFNRDGKLDFAVANNNNLGSGSVSILLGNGDGTFTTKSTPAAGLGANWLAVGDFNEDGKPDLAVANLGSTGTGGVSILLGNGDGTFALYSSPNTGNGPFAITTADFNGDGHLDLAVSNQSDGTVTVLLGNGTGSFTATTQGPVSVGDIPQVIVAGDFNNDGKIDLAVTSEDPSGTVSVLLGNGDGTFQSQSVIPTGGSGYPIGLIAADYNHDGNLDLGAVNASDVGILLGNGLGSFTLKANPTTGSGYLIAGVAGDYNGDGKLDLVVSDLQSAQAFLLPGIGDGTFGTAVAYTTAAGAFGVATADFNGDGGLDLAITNGGANNVSIFLQSLPVALKPTSLSFGNQLINTSSSFQSTTLTNSTSSTLGLTNIGFTGTESSDFSQTNDCGSSVPNNSTCTIDVIFTPSATGSRTATLTVTDTGSNSPQTLAVSGTGTDAPAITSANNTAFGIGTAQSFTVTTSGYPAPSLSETGPLPTGVTFTDNGDGTAALAGTPAIGSGGTYTISISASNGIGSNATQSFTLTVAGAPAMTTLFGASTIPLNGATSLTFTISNTNGGLTLNGLAFTDSLPSGLVVATPPNLSSTCSGAASASAGSSSVSLSGATIASNASCTVSLNVTGATSGTKNNSVTITSTNAGNGNTSNASITVVTPPAIVKAFGAGSIPLNGSSSLSFTIQNNNTTQSLGGIAFADTLPAGLVISTPSDFTGSCGGGTITSTQGTNVVSLSGATIAANSSCMFSVNVTGMAAGQQNNTTNNVASTEGGTGGTASASLAVVAPPSISKTFNPAAIALNATSQLTFTVSNPAANTVAVTGVAFTDTLPAGLTVATPNGLSNSCSGTSTAIAGSTSISLAGGSIAVNSSCTIIVNVTGTASGQYTNTTSSVTSTNGGSGNTASGNLTVASAPSITNAFGASEIPLNGATGLTFTIQNANTSVTLTGLAFTDSLPAGIVVATPSNLNSTCTGTATGVTGSSSTSLTGGTLAAGASCTVSLNISGSTAGIKNNSVQVTSTEGGTGNTSNTSITVVTPPAIVNAFGAGSIPLNGSISLSFTIQNNNTTQSLSGIGFSDTLPAGLMISTPNGLTGSCGGGTITGTQGTNVVSLSGATIAAIGSCTFTVNVTGTMAGQLINTTSAVTSTEGGTGPAASSSLTIVAPPSLATAFAPGSIAPGANSVLSFTITNPAANTVPLAGIAFTDVLPSGLAVATPNGLTGSCGSGTITAGAGSGGISLTGGSIPASGSCTFAVNVTASAAGTFLNTTGAITSTNGGTGNSASSSLAIATPPSISAVFGVASIGLAGSTSLSFIITNPNSGLALTAVAFNDALPAGIVVSTPSGLSGSCGSGTTTTAAGSQNISLTRGTIASSSSCSFSVNVTAVAAGNQVNTTSSVSAGNAGTGNVATASLNVLAPDLTIAASHTGNFYQGEVGAVYTVNVNNTGDGPTAGTVTVTEIPPPGSSVTAMSGAGWNCSAGMLSCTRTDALASGAAYPTITVSVNIAATEVASVTDTVTVSGGGELNLANDTASDTTTVTLPADFTLSLSTPMITITAAGTANSVITITPQNNAFTSAIALTATGLPGNVSVTFSPSAVTPGASPATSTLAITTRGGDPFIASSAMRSGGLFGVLLLPLFGMVLSESGFGFGFVFGLRKRAFGKGRRQWLLLAMLALCGGFALNGCAPQANFQKLGTAAGTYTFTITASSGTTQHSIPATLVVQP